MGKSVGHGIESKRPAGLLGAGGVDDGEGVLTAEAVRARKIVGFDGHSRWSKHISKWRHPANLTLWAPIMHEETSFWPI
jgi:hypothetical protein